MIFYKHRVLGLSMAKFSLKMYQLSILRIIKTYNCQMSHSLLNQARKLELLENLDQVKLC